MNNNCYLTALPSPCPFAAKPHSIFTRWALGAASLASLQGRAVLSADSPSDPGEGSRRHVDGTRVEGEKNIENSRDRPADRFSGLK